MSGNSVAAIGECMLELSSQGGPDWRLGFAGDTLNTLWALTALTDGMGDRTYLSAFGDDPFSRQQIDFLATHGIGISTSPIIEGARPGIYAITLTGAERSFTYWRGDSAARQLASDPAALERGLEGRALVYFSGITLAILDQASRTTLLTALSKARRNGSRIAFDANYRPRLWQSPEEARATTSEALAVTDIALPTFPDEVALFGDGSQQQTATRLAAAGVSEIVVKNGESPAFVLSNGAEAWVPAVSVEAVDTTGAGDSFNGGYLAARLKGDEPEAAAGRAHAVAAAVVQVRGALAPFDILRKAFAA